MAKLKAYLLKVKDHVAVHWKADLFVFAVGFVAGAWVL